MDVFENELDIYSFSQDTCAFLDLQSFSLSPDDIWSIFAGLLDVDITS